MDNFFKKMDELKNMVNDKLGMTIPEWTAKAQNAGVIDGVTAKRVKAINSLRNRLTHAYDAGAEKAALGLENYAGEEEFYKALAEEVADLISVAGSNADRLIGR